MGEYCFDVSLNMENIGPHSGEAKLNFHEKMNEHSLAVYAPNGGGKTFISRMFRAAMTQPDRSNQYLSKGCSGGRFLFEIKRLENEVIVNSGSVGIELKEGRTYTITNHLGMIFHVFNSDFVDENVRPNNYNPQKNITGYILGRNQIDLTSEKYQVKELEAEQLSIKAEIQQRIKEALAELKRYGVLSSTSEYKRISENYLRRLKSRKFDFTFDEVCQKINMLNNIPNELSGITIPKLNVSESAIYAAGRILSQEYPKEEWDEEFVDNLSFIEEGIALIGEGEICPFCKQTLKSEAQSLISEYKRFLNKKKSTVYSELDDLERKLSDISDSVKNFLKHSDIAAGEIKLSQNMFPSLSDLSFALPDKMLPEYFDKLKALIFEKKHNFETSVICGDVVEQCVEYILNLRDIERINADAIVKANNARYSINKERLALKKTLCNIQATRYSEILSNEFSRLDDVEIKLDHLYDTIRTRENTAKYFRRDCFFYTLEFFLNQYFGDKYILDRNSFEVKFCGESVGVGGNKIFSEGERSILAFCYYLASVHLLINSSADYSRLFFVIDDPIVGMDFGNTRKTAQILGLLGEHFDLSGRVRLWVLSHSTEFIGCLAEEGIVVRTYEMVKGRFKPFRK